MSHVLDCSCGVRVFQSLLRDAAQVDRGSAGIFTRTSPCLPLPVMEPCLMFDVTVTHARKFIANLWAFPRRTTAPNFSAEQHEMRKR